MCLAAPPSVMLTFAGAMSGTSRPGGMQDPRYLQRSANLCAHRLLMLQDWQLALCNHTGTVKEGGTPVFEGADTARRIQSVERVFCSQTLASPSTACGKEPGAQGLM